MGGHAPAATGAMVWSEVISEGVSKLLNYVPSSQSLGFYGFCFVLTLLLILIVLETAHQRYIADVNKKVVEHQLPIIDLDTLQKYNGLIFPLVYCCVKGRVYDVSTSTAFAPGGSYDFLAGADATVGMGKMSHDRVYTNSLSYDELTDDEWECIDGWVRYMEGKYRFVARLREFEEYWKTVPYGPKTQPAKPLSAKPWKC